MERRLEAQNSQRQRVIPAIAVKVFLTLLYGFLRIYGLVSKKVESSQNENTSACAVGFNERKGVS
jgi:hypothetical protein